MSKPMDQAVPGSVPSQHQCMTWMCPSLRMQKWNEACGQKGAVTHLARLHIWMLLGQKMHLVLSPSVQAAWGSRPLHFLQSAASPDASPGSTREWCLFQEDVDMEITDWKLSGLDFAAKPVPLFKGRYLFKSIQTLRMGLKAEFREINCITRREFSGPLMLTSDVQQMRRASPGLCCWSCVELEVYGH